MPRRLPEVTAQVGLTRGDRGALSLPAPGASGIEALAGLTQDIAAAGFEISRQRDTAVMIKEMSDIQISNTKRMESLALNGTGGRPLAEVAVEEFVKDANDFIGRQPAYLRDAARERMLGMKDRVAATALATQAKLAAQEMAQNTLDFANNITNEVRFGTLSQADALSQAKDYVDSLPENVRREASRDLVSSVKLSNLYNIVEQDPHRAKRMLRSGDYNDLDPNDLQRLDTAAQASIDRAAAQALQRQNEILMSLHSDPAKAAMLSGAESIEQRWDMQVTRLGVHPENASVLTKDEVKNEYLALGDLTGDVDKTIIFLNSVWARTPNKQLATVMVNDFIKYANAPNEIKDVMAAYISVQGNWGRLGRAERQSLAVGIATMGQGKEIESQFNARGKFDKKTPKDLTEEFNSAFFSGVGGLLTSAGVMPDQIEREREKMLRVFRHSMNTGMGAEEARKLAFAQYDNLKKKETVWLPSDIADKWSTRPTSQRGRRLVQSTDVRLKKLALDSFIDSKSLVVPLAFSGSPDVFYETVIRDSEWRNDTNTTNTGDMQIRLFHSGTPVLRILPNGKYEQVKIPFDHLRVLLEDMY